MTVGADPHNGDATGTSFGETVRRLGSAQKAATPGTPAYSRFVNRRAGRVLAALASVAGLRPNHVTVISAAFSAAAIVAIVLVPPSWTSGVLITAGLLVGYAFDSADGQLARLQGGGSAAGEWFDHVVDSVKVVAIHLAVVISWFRFPSESIGTSTPLLLVPLAFALLSSVNFFAQILTDQMRRARGPDGRAATPPGLLRSLLVIPVDYGVFCLLFLLSGGGSAFVVGYCVLAACLAGFLAAALPKWWRELAAAPAPASGSRPR